jgi:hypothetical protein
MAKTSKLIDGDDLLVANMIVPDLRNVSAQERQYVVITLSSHGAENSN